MRFLKPCTAAFFALALFLPGAGCAPLISSGGSVDPASTTISGVVLYEDRTFDGTGFTGTANLPVRHAKVEAVVSGSVAATGSTDASGNYTMTFLYGSGTVYVRALTDAASPFAAVVKDNRDSSIYAVRSNDLSISPGGSSTVNLLADVSGAGPPFNIFDNMVLGQEKLDTLSTSAITHTKVTAHWYDGNQNGTYYQLSGGNHQIFLVGTSSDDDAYDDTVILHELGHYVAEVFSQDDSPGGSHTLTGHYDLRLAWSEGWAAFFGSLVRDLGGMSSPEYYVDTLTPTTLGFSYEIDAMTGGSLQLSSTAKGADNEVAVSAVLWDIYDPANDDTLSLGYDEIWSIFDNDMPLASVVTFETFWDVWEASIQSGQLAPLLADRDIRYAPDIFEDDDTVGTARTITPGPGETHTFFPAGDRDWFAISVTNGTQYTFKTENLGDGADTLLTLYDSDQTTPIAQNDDDLSLVCATVFNPAASTTPCLASKIVWTADGTKTVYLLAEPYRPLAPGEIDYNPNNNPDAVSQYGYYTLTITSP